MNAEENPTPGRRRGAPHGNQNARKHGYYSYVKNRQQKVEEIAFLRALVRQLYLQIRPDLPTPELMNVLRVMALASASLARLLKAHSGLNISSRTYREILDEALDHAIREIGE